MRYPLASSTWDQQEEQIISEVVASGQLTMGERVETFEKEFAAFFGAKYAVMVNSGSSANLLAVAALCYRGDLKPGDEVLVPAVSWATTYFPFHQYQLKLRFVDIDPLTLNSDLDQLERAITPATRAICAVNLLGNPNDFQRLTQLCSKHNLILLEDNCESMGATFSGKQCGTFGTLGTYSLFFSHHICAIEGGVITTDDEELDHYLRSLRSHGWTRHLPEKNHVEEKTGDPFRDSFRFVLPGYNLRPCEINGAVGSLQLQKLPSFVEARRENAHHFQEVFADFEGVTLQKEVGRSSWFGFALTVEEGRDQVVQHLQEAGIDVRPIVSGNFVKNPVVQQMDHSIYGDLHVADRIDQNGFFVGNHHYDLKEQIHYLREQMERCMLQGGIA